MSIMIVFSFAKTNPNIKTALEEGRYFLGQSALLMAREQQCSLDVHVQPCRDKQKRLHSFMTLAVSNFSFSLLTKIVDKDT